MAEHKDLPNNLLHEPKGVDTAADGEVYVANGVGGGSWIDVSLVNPHNTIAYADKVLSSLDAPEDVALIAAVQADLRLYDDYVSFTDKMVGQPDLQGISFDVNGNFVIPVNGIYQFNFWMSESNTISDGELGISLYRNQLDPNNLTGPLFGPVVRDKTKTSTDINVLAFSGTISLDATDVLGVCMAAVKTGVVTISDASMSLILLEDLS